MLLPGLFSIPFLRLTGTVRDKGTTTLAGLGTYELQSKLLKGGLCRGLYGGLL